VKEAAFRAFVVLFWALLFVPNQAETVRFSPTYFLLVGSAYLFVLVFLPFVLHRVLVERPLSLRWETAWLLGMGLTAGLVAVLRGDLSTIVSVSLIVLVLAIIFELELVVPVALLNALAIASIPLAILSYHYGFSDYGYVPGQSTLGEEQGRAWRVSLFPGLPENGFFCALVLLANFCQRGQRFALAGMAIALYFLLLSGVRSAMLALALAGAYWWIANQLRGSSARVLAFVAVVALIVASPFSYDAVVYVLQALDWAPLWTLMKIDPTMATGDVADSSTIRSWIWSEHLRLWLSSPAFLGIGTYDFSAVTFDAPAGHDPGTGSESFITSLLARIGVPALFIVAAIFQAARKAFRSDDQAAACFAILLLGAMLTYGSMLTPYNLLFYLMFSALNTSSGHETHRAGAAG
jgi:hypothetical protein